MHEIIVVSVVFLPVYEAGLLFLCHLRDIKRRIHSRRTRIVYIFGSF